MVGKSLRYIALQAAALVCTSIVPSWGRAQISPGELSRAHASLEGITNCTQCHTLGRSVDNDNCLTCHGELRTRIAAGKGFHAGFVAKQCAECHKEHNGRGFPLAKLDTDSFDHSRTGFVLEGKHRGAECAKCHSASKISAPDVRRNSALMSGHTFLGLSQECITCHADAHKAQLGSRCQQCHEPANWRPAGKFVHDRTRFPLVGKHVQVACAQCHTPMPGEPKTMKFAGLRFERCQSCHADPHRGKFPAPCETCHSTNGWNEGARKNVNHAATRFPLRGRHASVQCERCHVPVRAAGGRSVQEFRVRKSERCSDCHADAHAGEFAGRRDKGACEECHTEQGFVPSQFKHATARFMLAGKHETVECRSCHGAPSMDARGKRIPADFRVKKHAACADCHRDEHGGQFARRPDKGACEKCHTVEGFTPSVYTARQHVNARFPLVGGHAAIACAQCHLPNRVRARSTVQFLWRPDAQCETCHRDPHRGEFATTQYPGCRSCHAPAGWKDVSFAHDRTKFPLTGKHVPLACAACHLRSVTAGAPRVRRFAGTPARCVDCHPQGTTTELTSTAR